MAQPHQPEPGAVLDRERHRRLRHALWRQADHAPRLGRRRARGSAPAGRRRRQGPGPRTFPFTAGGCRCRNCSTLPRLGPSEISERDAAPLGPAPMATGSRSLFGRIAADAASAEEIAPGVPRAELEYAVEIEDAMTAEDFLLRRTKLHLTLTRLPAPRWRNGSRQGPLRRCADRLVAPIRRLCATTRAGAA